MLKIYDSDNSTSKIDEAINSLLEFDYCFKLNSPDEIAMYDMTNKEKKEEAYLFPSLRPSDGEYAIFAGFSLLL